MIVVTLVSCERVPDPSYYFLERPESILLLEEFDWSSEECSDCNEGWIVGVSDGFPQTARVQSGFFLSLTRRNLALSTRSFSGPVRIIADFEIWNTDATTPTPIPLGRNGDEFDFRIVLADETSSGTQVNGPGIEVSLFYDSDSDSAADSDILRIRDSSDLTTSATEASRPISGFIKHGQLVVIVVPDADPAEVYAQVFDNTGTLALETSRTFADGVPQPFYPVFQISTTPGPLSPAGATQPRVYDTVQITRYGGVQ